MKNILVPTDFSTCANNALNFAVQSAKILSAKITVMHAFEQKGDLYMDYMGINREFNQTVLADIGQQLDRLKTSIAETEGIEINTFVSNASLHKSIVRATIDNDIDMVIMGTLGASGVQEKLWGSNTAAVIGKCPVPLLAIPFYYKWKHPRKFLLATNRFEKKRTNTDFVFELSDLYMGQVDAVVYSDEEKDGAATLLQQPHSIPQYESVLRKKYHEQDLTVNLVIGHDFQKSIQDYITTHEIDILAMITYQHTLTERIFHSSATKHMASHSAIPLLVIPGTQE